MGVYSSGTWGQGGLGGSHDLILLPRQGGQAAAECAFTKRLRSTGTRVFHPTISHEQGWVAFLDSCVLQARVRGSCSGGISAKRSGSVSSKSVDTAGELLW